MWYPGFLDLVPEVKLRILCKEKHTAAAPPLKVPPLTSDKLEVVRRLLYHTFTPLCMSRDTLISLGCNRCTGFCENDCVAK